jgi:hypothetical protein
MLRLPLGELMVLFSIVLFFLSSILAIYPNHVFSDMSTTYGSAMLLNYAPASFQSPHVWFEYLWAVTYVLSPQKPNIFIFGMTFLGITVLLAFYLMARQYLGDIDHRAPIISTIFFFLGAGFGWFYYVGEKLGFGLLPGMTDEYSLLNNASTASYWDGWSGQASWLWIWFRSITVGAVLFFCLIYLLARQDLTRRKFVFVSALLVVSLGMIHFTELVQFCAIILGLILFFGNLKIRLRDGVIGLVVGACALLGLNVLTSQSQNFIDNVNIIGLVALSFICFILLHFSDAFSKINRIARKIMPAVLMFLVVIFLLIVSYWTQHARTDVVFGNIAPVPLGLYPVLLGVAGLFGIFGAVFIIRDFWGHKVAIFLVAAVAVFLIGQIVTYANVNISYTGYNERRFVPFVYSALCILAAVAVTRALPKVSCQSLVTKTKVLTKYFLIFLVIMIIIGSLMSTFLVVLTQKYAANYGLSSDRVSSLNFLSNQDYVPVMLTATERSYFLTSYVPVEYKPYHREMFWDSTSPLIPFKALSSLNSDSLVYLTKAGLDPDTKYIAKNYRNSYLYSDLLQQLPVMYNNSEVTIINVPVLAPPTPSSDFMLVQSENKSIYDHYAYELLSLSKLNYTVAFLDDINTLRNARVVVAPTEDIARALITEKSLYDLPFSRLFVLNVDGYGILSNPFLDSSILVNVTTVPPQDDGINLNWVTSTEFSVSANMTDFGSPLLLGSNYSDSWIGGAYGKGSISEAVLSDSSDVSFFGNASLKVTVGEGNYGYWGMTLNVANDSSALKGANFISFYLYGNEENQNDRYCFTASENTTSHIVYRFYVDWTGWKKVMLPTSIPDGEWTFSGLSFVKSSTGDGDWSKMVSLQITPSAESINNAGVFYMSNFALEKGITIEISIDYDSNKIANIQILNYNSTNFVPLFPSSNRSDMLSNYFFESGLNASQILGDFAHVYSSKDDFKIQLSLILPPTKDESIRLRFEPTYLPTYLSTCSVTIVATNTSVELPANISLTQFATRSKPLNSDTLAFYQTAVGNVPFAETLSYKDFDMTYFNIYPLIQYVQDQKPGYRDLFIMLPKLAQLTDLLSSESSLSYQNKDPGNLIQNMVAFKPSSFSGNVSVTGKSALVMADSITLTIGNSTLSIDSPVKITCLNVSNIIVKSQEVDMHQGRDFYANMTVTNATISFVGNPTATIVCDNGTSLELSHNVIMGEAKSMHLLIAQPHISVEGSGTLKTFEALGNFQVPRRYDTKEFYGDDVSFKGNLDFSVDYSDTFTFVRDFRLTGTYYIGRPLQPYSDTAMWVTILPYALVFLIALFAIKYLRRKQPVNS